MSTAAGLHVLVVDDERPARDELEFLLRADARVARVRTADSATTAVAALKAEPVDAVFLDVEMPGSSGLALAGVLRRHPTPPAVVFVTAHDEHAVDAFDLSAVDYVLKPVRAERLAEAVGRVVARAGGGAAAGEHPAAATDLQIPVELGGVTRFVSRATVSHVEAQGDYVRLHTAQGSHLLRTPLSTLEEEWREAGFVRIHRSLLLAVAHVREVRMAAGRCSVVVGDAETGVELVVSRRHTRELRELLLHPTGSAP